MNDAEPEYPAGIDPATINSGADLYNALNLLLARTQRPEALYKSVMSALASGHRTIHPDSLRQILRGLDIPLEEHDAWVAALERVRSAEWWHARLRDRLPVSGTAEAEQAARRELADAEDELTAADELTLPALWKATHKRLDYYHEIATRQARQSFRNAQIAMGVGFVLLVVFAVLALTARSTAGAIVTGALGATSAAFAAYIGRTFVRSQETAATHLRSYFDQPLEFSRYLAAERLLNSVERLEPEQRAAITTDVVRGILSVQDTNGSDKPAGGADSP